MRKCQFLIIVILGAGIVLGYKLNDYYKTQVEIYRASIITEAIASGEIIRTSHLELQGWDKSKGLTAQRMTGRKQASYN